MTNHSLTLSIVIGTKDRPLSLTRCLRSLVVQTRRPEEVLIIDDGRMDADPLLRVLEHAGIGARYFNKSHDPGLTKSRNLGIRESTGDVVLFLDDDVILDAGYDEAILRVYEEYSEAGGVGGRLTESLSPLKRAFLRFFLLDSAREGLVLPNGIGVLVRRISAVTPVEWLSGCNMSFRREVFDRFLFDENFTGNGWGDDRDFSYEVSRYFKLFATPAARLQHLEDQAGRASPTRFGYVEIFFVYMFFKKHMPRHLRNWAALWWSFVGITAKNFLRLAPAQIGGNMRAIRDVLRDVQAARQMSGTIESRWH